ncbi:MAG: ankyrin repeat domain-containing protein [Bryobacteraceae bacterium]
MAAAQPGPEALRLKEAINHNDLAEVQRMMIANPALHSAPIGYGGDGALTWLAECRVPRVPPDATRLAMAQWMIDNGSDPNQDGGGPLGRAALDAMRIPMMELLVANGADVNIVWRDNWPILTSPCETLDPVMMRWLIEHGADPNFGDRPKLGTALDYLLGAYGRDPVALKECIDILLAAGGRTRHDRPGVLAVIRGRIDELAGLIDADPALVEARYPGLDIGTTAARMLTLKGATLLHAATEFGEMEAAQLLVARGANVNARALVDESGVGGQTPLFHAATQRDDRGLPMVRFLVEHGADLSVRARVPGYYERLDEVLDVTALEYAVLFPGDGGPTQRYLRECSAA